LFFSSSFLISFVVAIVDTGEGEN